MAFGSSLYQFIRLCYFKVRSMVVIMGVYRDVKFCPLLFTPLVKGLSG